MPKQTHSSQSHSSQSKARQFSSKQTRSRQLCVVTGVGEATGASIVARFAHSGYQVAMVARNKKRLARLEREVPGARAFPCDVGDATELAECIAAIRAELGDPQVVIHNAVAATFDRFLDGDPNDLERNFRVNTTALLHLARAFAPAMIDAGSGVIIATGNTAALRGIPTYALFAPTKAAQRVLAQSLARDLGPQGIHVAYVVVDAAINAPWLGDDRPSWLVPPDHWAEHPQDYFANPNAIAEEIFHVAHQDRSTWSFDVELRPYSENW